MPSEGNHNMKKILKPLCWEIARLEETLKEQEETARELDSMLHAGKQAIERLRLMPKCLMPK
jgi:uncharacterized coiled-coil protein SlyX